MATPAQLDFPHARARRSRRAHTRAADYLRSVADVAQITVDGADASDVFSLIIHEARNLIGGASSTIGTLAPDSTGLTIRAADGASANRLQVGATVPVEMTLAAEVVRTGRPMMVRGPESAREPFRTVLLRFGLGPAMCVPLAAQGRVFGAMAIADVPDSPPFRRADLALLEAFAGQAVIALEFARLRDELRRLAVVDERERIARELHDGAIQGLFGLGLQLQEMAARQDVATTGARLDAAVERIDGVIRELRTYIAALRPGVFASLPRNVTEAPTFDAANAAEIHTRQKPAGYAAQAQTHGRATGSRAIEYRLRVIGEINQAILDGVDVDTVFGRLVHSARILAASDSAIAGTIRGDDRDALVLRAVEGAHTGRSRPGDLFQVDGTILAEAIRTGRPAVVTDVDRPAAAAFQRSRQLGIGAAVAVPLAVRGEVFGAVAVGWSSRRAALPAADVRLMAIFAAQAAIGLEYGRVRDEFRRLAIAEERERIARELHESVIQTLFGAGMGLQALATSLDDPTLTERLGSAIETIDGVIRDLRNYVFGVRPGILADRQVDRALRELAAEFGQRAGIVPVVEIDAEVAARLAGATATDVVQIAREALSNVAQHAQAKAARVTLRREMGSAVLEVADDGRGIAADEGRAAGQGLNNMRARAATLGGVFMVAEGLHGRGTSVQAVVPL